MADLFKGISVGAPSLDHPFGIDAWSVFSKLWLQARNFPPQNFRFVAGVTPMSTRQETALALAVYYITIFGGRELMKKREPFVFNTIFKVHNFALTVLSGGLLVLFIEQLLPTLVRHGLFYTICDADGGWTNRLVVLYYLNYLTKYLELLDTVFLVLKKKPLTFLHTYHHGATALLCYTQLVGLTPISWVPITLNLMVHVVMYWYYFQSARGIRVWWKEWITRLQILQFVIDLGFVYFATYTYFTSTYFQWMPNAGHCAGEEFAAISGCVILSSYLVLFIGFYIATYKKTGGKPQMVGRKRRNTATKATIDMARYEIPDVSGVKAAAVDGGLVDEASGKAATSGRANGPVTRSRKA